MGAINLMLDRDTTDELTIRGVVEIMPVGHVVSALSPEFGATADMVVNHQYRVSVSRGPGGRWRLRLDADAQKAGK